jgi:heavy metal sensor kinase
MKTRSLRHRLVLWHAVWLTAMFTLAGTLLYVGLRHYLEANLAATGTGRAQRIAQLVRRAPLTPSRDLAAEIGAGFAPEASGRFVRVAHVDGRVVYQSGRPGDGSFSVEEISPAPHAVGPRQERQRDGTELIVATVAVEPDLLVEAGESFAPALSELRRLLVTLAVGFIVVGAVALGGGVVLVRRALRPVEEITRSAERISSRNLGERLPVPPTGDEFELLSQALNRMITRLDDAFQHNRRFLADASHELRTPLTILRSELEAVVRRPDLVPELRATAGDLLDEVERLTRIVENLFALSRLDAGQAHTAHARFDLAKLVATTSEQMCLLAEDKGLALTCDAPAPVPIEGDPARIKQVVVNLLDNAIKYTPAGGTVKLGVSARAGEAVLEVADSGIGIPPEAVPRVFDRFFRVDAARSREVGGAGIGLSIVKAICTAHNGRVEVESAVDRGSCFRVRLPLGGHPSLSL